jgi:hypothetical protein
MALENAWGCIWIVENLNKIVQKLNKLVALCVNMNINSGVSNQMYI